MPSALPFIVDVNDPNQQGLYADFETATPTQISDLVRNDQQLAILIRPVVESATNTRPLDDDWEATDEFRFAIGRPDEPPTGGTFDLEIDGQTAGLSDLAFDITALALTAVLSAASVAGGNPTLTVTQLSAGVYQVDGNANGEIPLITYDDTALRPASQITVSQVYVGDASTKGQQIIVLKQQPVAYAEPSTPLPGLDLGRVYDQTPTPVQNCIVRITYGEGGIPYDGLFSVEITAGGVTASCGNIGANYTAQQFGLILANHPAIRYQNETDADNIIVSKDGWDFILEFTGTLAGSTLQKTLSGATVANPTVITTSTAHGYRTGDTITITSSSGITPSLNGVHSITVISPTTFSIPVNVTVSSSPSATIYNNTELTLECTNFSLLVPEGVTGVVDLNTVNLAKAFWATTEDELTFEVSIERERISGEIRTLLLGNVTLKRDIIDVGTIQPLPITSVPLTTLTGVNYFPLVTGYTGGGSTNLDGISTTSRTVPQLATFVHPTEWERTYRLRAGTDVESSPAIIRPDDFNASTNAKVWESVS